MSETYDQLTNFINSKMQMQQVYQPVMLKEILQRDGVASVADIAKALLNYDTSQAEYFEHITKNMVGEVLSKNHGVTEKVKEGRRIIGYQIPFSNELDDSEVQELVSQCEIKINEYLDAHGDRMWSHRRKTSGYISGTLRYEVFKRAKFRCELCGISAADKALEADHIIPRNKGGSDDISNLQALCYSCNAMKRDRDDTDFRDVARSYADREESCFFCSPNDWEVLTENELAFAYLDSNPVSKHHTLFIPKRHAETYFDLYQPEINAIHQLLEQRRHEILEADPNVTAFNIGMNCGGDAGQSVFHCHVHLIPRRKGDVENARGGVRGVIPDKRIY